MPCSSLKELTLEGGDLASLYTFECVRPLSLDSNSIPITSRYGFLGRIRLVGGGNSHPSMQRQHPFPNDAPVQGPCQRTLRNEDEGKESNDWPGGAAFPKANIAAYRAEPGETGWAWEAFPDRSLQPGLHTPLPLSHHDKTTRMMNAGLIGQKDDCVC